MSLAVFAYCDRCKKKLVPHTGAEVMKHTTADGAFPTLHLCEKCFKEVFARFIKENLEKIIGGKKREVINGSK